MKQNQKRRQTLESVQYGLEISFKYTKICTGFFWSENSKNRETNILAVLRLKIPFQRDAFRFNKFSTFRETTFKLVSTSSLGIFNFLFRRTQPDDRWPMPARLWDRD